VVFIAGFLDENFLIFILVIAWIFTVIWTGLLRERLRMNWSAVLIVSALHVVYGVLTVKVFAFLAGGATEFGALSIFGAVFFMPVAYVLGAKLTKRPMAEVFDIFCICTVFTLLCSRVNCLHAGCCLGRYIGSLSVRYPTREAEMLFYAVFLFLMAPKVFRGKTNGEVYPLYMGLYGLIRMIIEFFRVSDSQYIFHLTHVWAVLALALGLSVYFEMKARRERRKTGKRK